MSSFWVSVLLTLALSVKASEIYNFDLGEIEYGDEVSSKQSAINEVQTGEVPYDPGYTDEKHASDGNTGTHGFQYGSQFDSPISDDYDQWDEWGVVKDGDTATDLLKKRQINSSKHFTRFGYTEMVIVSVFAALLCYCGTLYWKRKNTKVLDDSSSLHDYSTFEVV